MIPTEHNYIKIPWWVWVVLEVGRLVVIIKSKRNEKPKRRTAYNRTNQAGQGK